ncbi:MAG TPA: hypothetical protein VJA21_08370 [Verrucomicrobiae bacterium]
MESEQPFLKCACDLCGQRIEYPASYAGESTTCPACNAEIILPALAAVAVPPLMPSTSPPPPLPAQPPPAPIESEDEGVDDQEGHTEEQDYFDYLESEDGKIDEQVERLNFDWANNYREVTRDEVKRAWHHVKSKTDKAPETTELLDALEELLEDFRYHSPARAGYQMFYCIHCRGGIEYPFPPLPPGKGENYIKYEDAIWIPIVCPHCGKQTEVMGKWRDA